MIRKALVLFATAALALAFACTADDPNDSTMPSPTITAPAPQSPASGATVSGQTPTLVVANATGASGLRYRFEVASDDGFSSMVAAVDDFPEGSGTTRWTVAPKLASGVYFWRARAATDTIQGQFSSAASFEIESGFIADTPVNGILVSDPLSNGMSVGQVGGGEFRRGGWFTTDADSFIRYEIPTTPNGFVEFDVIGLRNPNPRSDKRNLLIMWDPTLGDYTQNPFRVHIAKYDTNLVNFGHLRLRFISNGEETNDRADIFDWNPNRVYNFRLEWGAFPAATDSQRARVLLDGQQVLVRNYDNHYRPSTHWVELGMAPRTETLEQVTFSNVVIGVRRP